MGAESQAGVSPQPTEPAVEHVNQQPGFLPALLWFAPAWGVLLILLSFVLPLVTVWSGHDGIQPQVSLVQAYGLAGVLPAVASLAVALLTASVLAFGRRPPSRASLTLARCIAGCMIFVGLLAPVVFHRTGLLLFPLAVSLLAVALISEVPRQPDRTR